MTGNVSAALAAYDEVLSFLNTRPTEKNDELLNWSEEALYRAALIRLREGYVRQGEDWVGLRSIDARLCSVGYCISRKDL